MPFIHMQTESVLAVARQLQAANQYIREQAAYLENSAHVVEWMGPSRDQFLHELAGLLAGIVRQTEAGAALSQRVEREVQEWEAVSAKMGSGYLDLGSVIRNIAATPIPALSAIGAVVSAAAVQQGQVLGINSLDFADLKQVYQFMPWSEKFSEERSLQIKIAELKELINRECSVDSLTREINEIDGQISTLDAKRTAAEKNAKNLINGILPNRFPPVGNDGDGNPFWRSKADDYEDEIADYDARLRTLKSQRDLLVQQRQTIERSQHELANLEAKSAAVSAVIDEGIAPDGPTRASVRNQLGGCTHYVAEKRDVFDWPNAAGDPGHPKNATYWNDQASQAGYEVGELPAKGSIIVFEAGYDPDGPGGRVGYGKAGHVGYVERVTRVEGGYQVEFSHANTRYTDQNQSDFYRGVHDMNRNSTKFIPDDGISGISFIYDKK